jgi:uncharacterized membrane protein
VVVAGGIGVAAYGLAAGFVAWQAATLIGWSATAAAYLVQVWSVLLRHDARATASHATRIDDSRLAVVLLLATSGAVQAAYTGLAVGSVVLSWAVVHTIFTLRYGHLYYGGDHGLDFHDEGAPTYRDFAYLAFTVGMTYQVSDTEVTSSVMRSTVLRHALLSFLFGTAIIATTINLVAGLLR